MTAHRDIEMPGTAMHEPIAALAMPAKPDEPWHSIWYRSPRDSSKWLP